MKLFKQAQKYGAKIAANVNEKALAAGVAMSLALPAFAQSTDPFDLAMTEIKAKVATYGGALVGLAAVGVVFVVAIKYVKRIPRAS